MEQIRFEGRVAIVTGAGRGVGREHALMLASRGAAVVVNDIGFTATAGGASSTAPATGVVAEIEAAGGRAVASFDDVSTAAGCANLVAQALDTFGHLDIVISNAGTNRPMPFAEMTEADFDFLIRQHVHGSFHTVKAAWPHLVKKRRGRILLTTSGTGFFGLEGQVHYGAAKGAIFGMMRTLALEGAPHGIHVNAFWPSAFTRMVEVEGELKERMRRGMPATLTAPAALWLVHENCTLNGEVLHAGSGRVSRVLIAETRGHYSPEMTLETVAAHQSEILSEEGYCVFGSAIDSSLFQSRVVAEATAARQE
jgi:NAD(P)-dependent dehydrogenase (short-subunit alcohol dehydrogenase family)